MAILHICNDFSYTKVHRNLYSYLDKLGCKQVIFNPLQAIENKGKNDIKFEISGSSIIYSRQLKKYHHLLFKKKIDFLEKELLSCVKIEDFNLIHATTLFSDGALAYRLFRKNGIPYIVTVRNTDINVYLKYRPDLILLAHKILSNASKVVFISKSNFRQFSQKKIVKPISASFTTKTVIIPNAIDNFWHKNRKLLKKHCSKKILFIGRFDKNKNVKNLLKAFFKLQEKYPTAHISLVGGKGELHNEVLHMIDGKKNIEYLGYITGKQELLKIFRSHDIFAMVSFNETFGLVYLEAISQHLPILYSRNKGISGEFKLDIGEEVNPMDISEIEKGLEKIILNYEKYNLNEVDLNNYKWTTLAQKYLKIYNQLDV